MTVRIAYLVSQYPAPSHTFIRREISALRKLGVPIDIFSVRPPRPEEVMSELDGKDRDETAYLLPAGVAKVLGNNVRLFLRAPWRYLSALALSLRHRNPGLIAFVYAFFYFLEGMLLAEELQARGTTHLHNHFANNGSHVAMVATRYLNIEMSLTLHGLCDFDFPAGPLLQEKLAASKFVVCATQYGVGQAMRLSSPSHWSKLSVVRCGIEVDKLPSWTPRQTLAGQTLKLICVGRLAPEKGQLGLLEAFAIAVRRGLDAQLSLVGDGPDRPAIEERIAALALADRVRLLGRLPEARALEEISRSDVLVLASFMEGLPVVLMEAMALEVPVIAPNVAGIPELVDDQVGLRFAAGDWNELAERMLELGEDPERRLRMGLEGRLRVAKGFVVDQAVRPLYERFTGSTLPSTEPAPGNALSEDEAQRASQKKLRALSAPRVGALTPVPTPRR